MSTVQEILRAMDHLSSQELLVLKLGAESRLEPDDDPASHAAIEAALTEAETHPSAGMAVGKVRALIPKWVSESKSIPPL